MAVVGANAHSPASTKFFCFFLFTKRSLFLRLRLGKRTMVERLIPGVPGLQPERTDLSWVRTTASALLNGGLLLLRHSLAGPSLLQLTGGCLALILALFTF